MKAQSFQLRLRDYAIAAFFLAGVADALFFDDLSRSLGLSVSLFAAFLASAIVVCHRRFPPRALAPYLLFPSLALLALVENVDVRSLVLMTTCLAVFAMAAARRLPSLAESPAALGHFLLGAPLALLRDERKRCRAQRRASQRGYGTHIQARVWLVWVMPLALALGFVMLLGAGNPILERWLALIDPFLILSFLSPHRILFWVLVVALAWPFLRPRLRRYRGSASASTLDTVVSQENVIPQSAALSRSQHVYGQAAILRALILFNAVFAVQTLLDVAYLWGGLHLPEGISYAAYAHRGAYMLVVTALLAAVFVLVALKPGGAAAGDRRIRGLVYLWIGQNVVLVLSAMLRLDLYVDVYALTQLRLVAFVWMGVVAAGLVLICLRIGAGRSNQWLVGANLAVLSLVFVGSCFFDDRAVVARFNVSHSREVSGRGVGLDVDHLVSLGPAAIPAIDSYLSHTNSLSPATFGDGSETSELLRKNREWLAHQHSLMSQDWRSWTFRNWRLSRYLTSNASAPVPPIPVGPSFPPVAGSN